MSTDLELDDEPESHALITTGGQIAPPQAEAELLCRGFKIEMIREEFQWLALLALGLVCTIIAEGWLAFRSGTPLLPCIALLILLTSGSVSLYLVRFGDPGIRYPSTSDSPEEPPELQVYCPANHLLQQKTADQQITCDECASLFAAGERVFACTAGCDFDLCPTCCVRKDMWCRDCHQTREGTPATVHCFDCKLCVEGRIHHCHMIGTCIGSGNYRSFAALLGFTASWGAVVLSVALSDVFRIASHFMNEGAAECGAGCVVELMLTLAALAWGGVTCWGGVAGALGVLFAMASVHYAAYCDHDGISRPDKIIAAWTRKSTLINNIANANNSCHVEF